MVSVSSTVVLINGVFQNQNGVLNTEVSLNKANVKILLLNYKKDVTGDGIGIKMLTILTSI